MRDDAPGRFAFRGYHSSMPYVTFAETREILTVSRMKEVLAGHSADLDAVRDDGASHPFFDQTLLAVQKDIDDGLDNAGYAVPVDSSQDSRFRLAVIHRLVDFLTKGNSNREPWCEMLAKAADEYFDEIKAGTRSIDGGEPTTEPQPTGIADRRVDVDFYDSLYPSEREFIFPSLGNPYKRW